MKIKIRLLIKAFLTAAAFSMTFHAPLVLEQYETKTDYIIASIYELLGAYDFTFLLFMVVCVFFYQFAERKRTADRQRKPLVLAAVFSLFLLLGRSYDELGNGGYCFGSVVNFIKTVLAFAGYSCLFEVLIGFFEAWLEPKRFVTRETHFFSTHGFLKSFVIIMAAYSPFLLLSFPGNLCWDVIGQIEQVIFETGYSTHHPLAHTLLVGGLVQLGKVLFNSYELGLFVYMILQAAMLAAAQAATVSVLAKRKVRFEVLLGLVVLYCITPVYSNIVSTAIKDVPFMAFVILYVIGFACMLEQPELIKNKGFVTAYVFVQLGMVLFRNNGLYMLLLSGMGAFLFLFKKYDIKERIACAVVSFGAGFLISKLILLILVQLTSASAGSKGEMLSIPFQQTARYLQFYKEEISQEEREAIEAVLGDVNEVAAKYDPTISDPVKALYKKDASMAENLAYLKAWFQGFLKAPKVYFDACLVHIYGWFTPSVSNAIRYEVSYDEIRQGGLFENAEKLLIFYYRFADRFTLLGALQNIGLAVWGLFFATYHQLRQKKYAFVCATLPLWVSLLICMASPCYWLHPRYGFPILFTLPFLFIFMVSGQERRHDETV